MQYVYIICSYFTKCKKNKSERQWRHKQLVSHSLQSLKMRLLHDVTRDATEWLITSAFNLLPAWKSWINTFRMGSKQLFVTYLWPRTSLIFPLSVLMRKQTSVGIKSGSSSKKAARFRKCFDSCHFLRGPLVLDIVRDGASVINEILLTLNCTLLQGKLK